MPIVRISSKGQIVIPKEIRDKLGIGPGKEVLLQVVGEHVEIVPLPDGPIKFMRGMLKADISLAEELLRERRRDDEINKRRGA
jgi:AbrB family looped-hinge helix DNA binding protein